MAYSQARPGFISSHADVEDERVVAVVDHAARLFGVTVAELVGARKRRPLVHYRQVAMAACRTLTDASYPTIALTFHRDRSTVMHGVARMADDPATVQLVESFRRGDSS
jgi:chromosomal replication initiation ATPase DnaA